MILKEGQLDLYGPKEEVLKKIKETECTKIFDLTKDILLRVIVLQIEDDEYLLPLENIQRARVIPVFDEG